MRPDNSVRDILAQCLAYEVLRSPEGWLGAPCPNALQAFLAGVNDRAGFTRADLPEWRIAGPLGQAAFYTPLVEATGHPTLSIRWATALELIHFSMADAITDLRDRVEAWAVDFDPSSSPPSHFSPPADSVRELLGHLAARPGLYLGRNSSWRLYCYLNGLDRGGDWLGLPPLRWLGRFFLNCRRNPRHITVLASAHSGCMRIRPQNCWRGSASHRLRRRPHNPPMLWTTPRRVESLSLV